jgi:hypothetical protein
MSNAEKWAYIFRKKPEDSHRHDWNMEFPNKENPLAWVFVCSKCGRTRTDMPSIYEMLR